MIKPLVFVAVPLGKKFDPAGTHEIDFDRVYELAIKPAVAATSYEVLQPILSREVNLCLTVL